MGYALPTHSGDLRLPTPLRATDLPLRQLLDVLVITIGVVLISEATVLGVVRQPQTPPPRGLARAGLSVADIAIGALVLCFGMRQQPGDRVTWLFLGSGLLFVAITDSIYVRLMAEGQTA